ncbi:hypothetical protein O0881_02530 [Janthinobacterium sp. SUN100]|uniref:hypothetical protein n=1 Tax=Janthinobacterium sp. SUN100 TaxID=3004101 RepID=UPI0025AF92CA|nr:hypothetical protein [Janthinobacterium sp. SUN100]MDN2700867.1 hypothetical protein [Janthinobacterium sp. SUN100]
MTLAEEKQIAEIENLRADRFKTMSTLFAGFSSTFGLIVVFIYCFFVIEFFPSGLSVGDTLLFIFVMLAFSCIGALSVIMGFFPFVPWSTQKTLPSGILKKNEYLIGLGGISLLMAFASFLAIDGVVNSSADSGKHGIALLVAASCLIFIYWHLAYDLTEDAWLASMNVVPLIISTLALGTTAALIKPAHQGGFMGFVSIATVILFSGMFLSLGISMFSTSLPLSPPAPPVPPVPPGPLTANPDRYRRAYACIMVGVLFAYIPLLAGKQSFNYVMSGLGLRSDSVLVVNKANFSIMQAAADAKGVLLHSCRFDSESYSISNMRVLWHGIGLRSYVELKGKGFDGENMVRIELDSAGIKVSRGGEHKACGELANRIYFDSEKYTLDNGQWLISKSFVDKFIHASKNDLPKKIIIVGFADPMPRKMEGNFVLAHKRACTVFHQLVDDGLIKKMDALIDVRLDRDNMGGCGEIKEAIKQRACFEQGRRVELQIVEGAGEVARAGTADALTACGSTAKKK